MLEKLGVLIEDDNASKKGKKNEKEGKKLKQTSILSFSKSNGENNREEEKEKEKEKNEAGKEKMAEDSPGSNTGSPGKSSKKRKHGEFAGEQEDNTAGHSLKMTKLNE